MDLGNYRLVRVLGEGGMGSVFEGYHRALKKQVAIKTLHGHLARHQEIRERFLREGQAAAAINHPNVVEVFDVGEQEDLPYLVMEYLHGRSLRAHASGHQLLDETRLADFMVPAIAGVAAAHDHGIVHRDLKTDNIFIVESPVGLIPKVVDFGISKVADQPDTTDLTDTAAFFGTPSYMAPEQTRSTKAAGPKSDQFSLGVILYELTTGKKPFAGASLLSLLEAIRGCEFELPHRLRPDLSAQLEGVILRALQHHPEDRYEGLRQMGCALLPLCSVRVRQMHAHELQEGSNLTMMSGSGALSSGELMPPSSEAPFLPASSHKPQVVRRSAEPHTQTSQQQDGQQQEGTLAASATLKNAPDLRSGRRQVPRRLTAVAVALLGLGALMGANNWLMNAQSSQAVVASRTSLSSARVLDVNRTPGAVAPSPTLGQQVGDDLSRQEVPVTTAPSNAASTYVVRSVPQARVLRADGTYLGDTPLTVELPPAGAVLSLVLEARGFSTRRLQLTRGEPLNDAPIALRPRAPRPDPEEPGLAPR